MPALEKGGDKIEKRSGGHPVGLCGELNEVVCSSQIGGYRIGRKTCDGRNDEQYACRDRDLSVCVHFLISFIR